MLRFNVYSPFRSWKKGDYPVFPFVNIAVGFHFVLNNGELLLSPNLMRDCEIDESIDYLIEELEKARIEAKKELRALDAMMLEK